MHTKLVKVSLSSLALLALALTGGPAVVRADKASEGEQDVSIQFTYDQLGGGTGSIKSQKFTSGTTASFKAAADIQVPAGPWFLVSQVTIPGTLNVPAGTTLQGVTIEFYHHDAANGRPGSQLSGALVLSSGLIHGTSVLNIPTVALKQNATYWFSVQANFGSYTGLAEWAWLTRSIAGTFPGAYISTNIPGCTVWNGAPNTTWDACGTSTQPTERDLQFSLTYTPFTPTAFIYLPLVSRN